MTTTTIEPKQTKSAKARDDFLAPVYDETFKYDGADYCDTIDMDNPRNWSLTKKRLLFAALLSSSLLADGYVNISTRLPKLVVLAIHSQSSQRNKIY